MMVLTPQLFLNKYIIVQYIVYNKILRIKNIQYQAHFEGIDDTIIMT